MAFGRGFDSPQLHQNNATLTCTTSTLASIKKCGRSLNQRHFEQQKTASTRDWEATGRWRANSRYPPERQRKRVIYRCNINDFCLHCCMSSTPRRPMKHTPVLIKASLERLGQRLTTARKLRQMNQEELAHLSDVSLSTLRALEDGADGVALGNVLKVLQGLNLMGQLEDLLDPSRDPEAVAFAVRKVR